MLLLARTVSTVTLDDHFSWRISISANLCVFSLDYSRSSDCRFILFRGASRSVSTPAFRLGSRLPISKLSPNSERLSIMDYSTRIHNYRNTQKVYQLHLSEDSRRKSSLTQVPATEAECQTEHTRL